MDARSQNKERGANARRLRWQWIRGDPDCVRRGSAVVICGSIRTKGLKGRDMKGDYILFLTPGKTMRV